MKFENKVSTKLILTAICLLFVICVTKADKYTFSLKNDTLYVTGDSVKFPSDVTIVFNNEINTYQKSAEEQLSIHIADDLHKNIWTCEKLNPYNTPIDSLPDSLHVDLSNYCIPAQGRITSRFGARGYRFHFGTDIKVATSDPIYSTFDGVVRIVDYERKGYGHYIVIRHANGLETVYAHLSKVWVKENQHVKHGDVIGLGGNTGRSTGSHLHFEIRYIGNAINPELIFDFEKSIAKSTEYIITKSESFYHQEKLKELAAIRYHTIKSGESLGKIAQKYGNSVPTLCRLNNMSQNTTIYAGKRIRVR